MKKIIPLLQLVTLISFLLSPSLKADNTTVTVGGQNITLPAPSNYFQVYGRSSNYDTFANSAVPPSNKLLAVFMNESSLADILKNELPTSGTMFYIQYNRKLDRVINQDEFNQLKQYLSKNIESGISKNHDLISQIADNASKVVGIKMNIQDPICIGTFGEDSNSLGFTILSRNEVNGDIVVSVASCIYALVKNRLLYIYTSKTYNDKADIPWCRDSAITWKNAILSAN